MVQKDRGKFLTVMIIWAAIGALQLLYTLVNTSTMTQAYGNVSWLPVYTIISLLAYVAAIIGLWLWKKWGVYLLAILIVGLFLGQLFIIKPIQFGQITYFMSIATAGLWFWAIYRKWKYFG